MAVVYLAHPPAALQDELRDGYVVQRVLGRGGMAMHPEIRATLGADGFQQEIRLAARLQHPHMRWPFAVAERLGRVLAFQRRWERARVELDRALSLAPTALNAIDLKVSAISARATRRRAADHCRRGAAGRPADAGRVPGEHRRPVLGAGPGRPAAGPLARSEAFNGDRATWGIALAQIHRLFGDSAEARAYADSARIALEAQLRAAPNDAQRHAILGLALAYLGRPSQGIREGERGVALLPVSKDAYFGALISAPSHRPRYRGRRSTTRTAFPSLRGTPSRSSTCTAIEIPVSSRRAC